MARRRTQTVSLDFAFFGELWRFYAENRGAVRRHYRELSKRFLDYNDPANSHSYLRRPQFEALEIYVFLKEFLDNEPLHRIFHDWADKTGRFAGRTSAARAGQLDMFEELTREEYEAIFARMRANARPYPNYIFALTMGTGKTILMATCIFYEFILANKFPSDARYCHNALVFAPDTTVLQSLKEIMTFDMARVVPPEYVNFLATQIKYHFLDEAGTTLSTIDRSRFNIIISNTQKVILKRQSSEKTPADKLFGSGKPTYTPGSVYDEFSDLYDQEPGDEAALTTNQRFQKLQRLEQLGIYVDEAHHAFGSQLARDMGIRASKTSLRLTIDELAASLDRAGTHVVGCFNYTGTPYVGREILPEVVYAYGLQAAIDNKYLKQPRVHGYSNPRSAEFVDLVIDDFVQHHHDERYEGMLPKLAFFAATIDELQSELRPAVEQALARHSIPADRVLVNVGDPKLTSNDDIRDFNQLDTRRSAKQFILLVGKGREGWNCRSLFGVALFRKPKSKIFVLQATMRCLREITDAQQTGRIYLSEENLDILADELQQNFRVTMDDFGGGTPRPRHKIRIKTPVEKVRLARIHHLYDLREKPLAPGAALDLDGVDTERYRLIHTEYDRLPAAGAGQPPARSEDLTAQRRRRTFSALTLVAEVARYLNKPCLDIERVLAQTQEGTARILAAVNEFNELLYDHIIPRLFNALYEVDERQETEEYEVDLVKIPPEGYYEVSADEEMVVRQGAVEPPALAGKSFHLDPYCFDSTPERALFWSLLREGRVRKLYFTGMLTHGQSDFFVQYIDPESHTVRSYYPDFLVQREDGSYLIVEVKGDNRIDDPVVQAKKEFAEQMAIASGMTYGIIKGSDAHAGRYAALLEGRAAYAGQPSLQQLGK
ncbi:MAG: DEAD/DEAH box helicase family protein [Anaerolineae bacterium]|nr:DEAD/DEAH box helicase family protein [Anaerolineae bacterium]